MQIIKPKDAVVLLRYCIGVMGDMETMPFMEAAEAAQGVKAVMLRVQITCGSPAYINSVDWAMSALRRGDTLNAIDHVRNMIRALGDHDEN